MPLKLYKADFSPPARSAMMVCDLLKVPVEMIDLDLFKREHMTPEFIEKNPMHTIPVLEDGDLTLIDSHAILAYLVDAYGKDDTLYPKDIKKRAIVNQRLFFDASFFFQRVRNVTYPALVEGDGKVTVKKQKDIEEAYSFVEHFLSKTKYLAGPNMTIADISAFTTADIAIRVIPLDSKKYPKTHAWMEEMKKLPCHVKYIPTLDQFWQYLQNALEFEQQ